MTYQEMTTSRWLGIVAAHVGELRWLVANYHPSAHKHHRVPITAPNAEEACRHIREDIRAKEPENPVDRWDKALAGGDVGTLQSLLEATWFGVPESTDCWSIPGFSVAVDLLDDPPIKEMP